MSDATGWLREQLRDPRVHRAYDRAMKDLKREMRGLPPLDPIFWWARFPRRRNKRMAGK